MMMIFLKNRGLSCPLYTYLPMVDSIFSKKIAFNDCR